MTKTNSETEKEVPLDALVLENRKDRYKLAYAALRWAKEVKQKENLPDPIPFLVPRALREILTGKVLISDVEKLPVIVKVAAPPAPAVPTITFNMAPEAESPKEEKA